jgi:hypothetical protein
MRRDAFCRKGEPRGRGPIKGLPSTPDAANISCNLFTLSGGWIARGLLAVSIAEPIVPALASTTSFLVLGLLIALDRRFSAVSIAALALAVGFLHGWLNGTGLAADG